MALHSEAKFDQKFISLIKQLNLYLNHFPNHEKYGLAQQIRNAAYDAYGFAVESQKRYQKKTSLTNLDIRHEQLRMFVRVAYELGYFEFKNGSKQESNAKQVAEHRFHVISLMIDEIGKMIGGWINSDREKRDAS